MLSFQSTPILFTELSRHLSLNTFHSFSLDHMQIFTMTFIRTCPNHLVANQTTKLRFCSAQSNQKALEPNAICVQSASKPMWSRAKYLPSPTAKTISKECKLFSSWRISCGAWSPRVSSVGVRIWSLKRSEILSRLFKTWVCSIRSMIWATRICSKTGPRVCWRRHSAASLVASTPSSWPIYFILIMLFWTLIWAWFWQI